MKKRILVAGRIHNDGFAILDEREDVTYRVLDSPDENSLLNEIPTAEAVIVRNGGLSADVIAAADNLKVASRHGVGYDSIALDALSARGIPLTIVGNVNAVAVAEHAMFMILALARQGVRYDRAVRCGDWDIRNEFGTHQLHGMSLLILGFGRIGREVSQRACSFGMRVFAYDPHIGDPMFRDEGVTRTKNWREILGDMDCVSVHLPRTDDTERLIGATELDAMKPSALLVNTARGGIVDERALSDALRRKSIAGAATDVFETEPPALDLPLLKLENTIFSPHSAALTTECVSRMSQIAANNVLDCFDGRLKPDLVVNKEVLEALP